MSILIVITVSLFLFFSTIDIYPLRNWDEAWYAEIIKNMAHGGYSLLVPFWNGQYYFDKPPLYFWLTLPVFKLFGPGEWQTRFISTTAAAAASLLIYLIGKKLFSKEVGLASTVVFLSLGQVFVRFKYGNLDALLIFMFLLCFFCYLKSQESKIYSFAAGISLGLGLLIKGLFVGLFPLFLILTYSLVTTRKLPKHLATILFSALVSSGWYYAAGFLKFGQTFTNWYLFNPSGGLLSATFTLNYIQNLIRDTGFWFVTPLVFLKYAKPPTKVDKRVLAAFFIVTSLFVLSLGMLSEKLGWYNLPAYPLVALSIGYFIAKTYEIKPKIAVFATVCMLLLQVYNVARIENIHPDRSKVGADLGIYAKDIIPPDATVVLDDQDFTSFLFYSDHKMVYVAGENGGKPPEWWILSYKNLPTFVAGKENVWLITKNPGKFNFQAQSQAERHGYHFFQLPN